MPIAALSQAGGPNAASGPSMKKARDMLLEMKVGGGDLTKPIGILKQASIHLKREEYADAVHYVKLFRDEVNSP